MEKAERTILYKITFFCFSLFIIFSGISITVSQGMLILTLLLWLYGCFSKVPDFQYNRTGIERYIAVFIVVSIILALLSPSKIENLLYLKDFWLISAFILASSLLKTQKDIVKIFYLFLVVALIQSVAAYIQYFADINYMNAVKYGAGHWRSRLPMGKIVMGFLGHHLTFGGYMMMISIPLFYLSFLKKRDNYEIPVNLIRGASVLAMITIVLSWARSVIIAMPFAIMPLIIKSKKKFIITFGIILGVTFLIFSELGPSNNFLANFYNESSMIRIQIWRNALNIWKIHPLIGAGGGNYDKVFQQVVKNNLRLDDQYYAALNEHQKSISYLNRIKIKKQKSADLFIEVKEELQNTELAYKEKELSYWGIEEFITEDENNYKAVYEKYILAKTGYEFAVRKQRNAEIKFTKEDKLFKSFEKKYDKSGILFIENFPSMVTHAHNDYLNQLARKGIIGLLAFLYMLYGILKYMFDKMKSVNDNFMRYFYMGLFGSFTAFLMASMFQCYYTDDENLVMLWLNVGILAGIVNVSKEQV